MSYGAASTPTPSRLVRQAGAWALELTRLVPLDGKVLEPRSQRLEGTDAILRLLRQWKDQPTLVHGAANLMRALRGEEDRAFVPMDGEWVPSVSEPAPRFDSESMLKTQLAELRAEFLLLRASHQRLRERVALLEARLQDTAVLGTSAAADPPLRPEARKRSPETPAAAIPTEATATPASPPVVNPAAVHELTLQSPGAAEARPEPHPFRDVVSILGNADAPPKKPIELPDAGTVIAAIAELLGADPGFAASDAPLPDSALELAALYAGRLLDDDGKDVGVLLADLKLVAQIGGKLVGLPTTVIDEQARTGVLNDQVMAAISEVVNTLSAKVNQVAGNQHVRGTPVEPFSAEQLHWLNSARRRLAIGLNRIGTIWLVGR